MKDRKLNKLLKDPNTKIYLTPLGRIVALGELLIREREEGGNEQ